MNSSPISKMKKEHFRIAIKKGFFTDKMDWERFLKEHPDPFSVIDYDCMRGLNWVPLISYTKDIKLLKNLNNTSIGVIDWIIIMQIDGDAIYYCDKLGNMSIKELKYICNVYPNCFKILISNKNISISKKRELLEYMKDNF